MSMGLIARRIINCGIFFLAWAGSVRAGEGVRLEAPEYRVEGGVLETFGRGCIHYEGYKIEADRIRIDRKNGDMWMQGGVSISGGKYSLETPFLFYNTRLRKGFTGPIKGRYGVSGRPAILDERSGSQETFGPFFMRARSAELGVNELGRFRILLEAPSFTDCDRIPPLHDLRASSAVLSSGEKMELWNLRPRILGFPYGYLPYTLKDLQYDWPWTSWEFGRNAEWGFFGSVRTHLLPGTLNKRSVVGLEERQERGYALKQDWNHASGPVSSTLRAHYFSEKWHSLGADYPVIVEDRVRTDLHHRRRLNDDLTARIEHHYLTPRESFCWSDGTSRVLSPNRFASPLPPGAVQERQSLLQDYYNEEFKTGRTLEDSLSVEYHKGRSFAVLSSDRRSDTELPVSPMREIEFKGRELPAPILDSEFLYSNDYGLGRMGAHFSEDLSSDDRTLLFGRTDLEDFLGWRMNYRQIVERHFRLGEICTLTPYVGSSHVMYENALNTPGIAAWNVRYEDLDEWHQNHRFLTGYLISNTVTGYFSPGPRRLKHVVTPSIQTDFISPSSFTREYIPARVDQLDEALNPRLKITYRLDNQVYTRRDMGSPRLLFSSVAQYIFLGRYTDNVASYGPFFYGGENVEFTNVLYPTSVFKLSSEIRFNTFHNQVFQHRDGFQIGRDKLFFAWYFLHIHNPVSPEASLDRHDLSFNWTMPSKTELGIGLSYDPDPPEPEPQRLGLYKHGFKTMNLSVVQPYYSLRGELQFLYDVESSGTTLLLRFGPRILGRNMPAYRMAF